MPRHRPSIRPTVVCITLFASIFSLAKIATAQSDSSPDQADDTVVAAWAAERFNSTGGEASPSSMRRVFGDGETAASPTRGNPLRAGSSAPSLDPFAGQASPPRPGSDRYANPSPPRAPSAPGAFPANNPLRGAPSVIDRGNFGDPPAGPVAGESPSARRAFDTPASATPDPTSNDARIAVGATPIEPPIQVVEPTPTPVENPTPPSEIPANDPFAGAKPIETATPPREWPATEPEATRVATASAYEPAPFDGQAPAPESRAFAPLEAAATGAQEGLGQPGPHELEGPQEASLIVEKRGPSEARIGHPCRFVVKVRNTGRGRAENVVLTDQTPAGARLLATVPTAETDGGRIVWRLGALDPGQERAVEMRLEPLREGPIGSVATVSMDASASASTVCTRPQLAVRMSAPKRVLVGDEQVVTIELQNPGTGTATGVMLTEDVPRGVSHAAGPELEFEVGALEPGETRRIDLRLSAEQAGHVVNTVRVVADGDLRVERSVEFDVIAPSLAVSIDGPKRRYLERPASYTIGVDNPGSAPAKDVRLVTHLPRGMEFVRANNLGEYDATTHSVYWSLAELPEGQRGEVEVVALPVAAGEHTVRVESEAESGLEASEALRTRVEGVAALAFEVRDLDDPIEVGGDTTYEVRVLNEGTKAAGNVRVRVEAPSGMRVVAAEGQTGHRLTDGRAEFAPIAQLPPGAKAAYRVRLRGVESGDQRVTVLVESDELSSPIRREESTRVFGDE